MANSTLFQFGPIRFNVVPNDRDQTLNVHAYEQVSSTEYARKMVMNSIPQREWVGEGDQEIILNGMVFPQLLSHIGGFSGPQRIGGYAGLELLEASRLNGVAMTLIRGDVASGGSMLGWFVLEHLERRHSYLSGDGVGKVIAWQGFFSRADQPDASTFFWAMNKISGP